MKKIVMFLSVLFIFLSISSTLFATCEPTTPPIKNECFLNCANRNHISNAQDLLDEINGHNFSLVELKKTTECSTKCEEKTMSSINFEQKTKYFNKYKSKIIYTKINSNTINIMYELFSNSEVYSSENLLMTSTFFDKFYTPYIAVKLPNGSTIDKSSLNAKLSYLEANAGLNKNTISEKLKANDWNWLSNNSERKEFTFTLDNSQDERILSVLNILHPAGEGKHWEILNFVKPDGFNYPKSNYFFNQMIEFECNLNTQTVPAEIEYLISYGKFEIGPIVNTIYSSLEKNAKKPALNFVGEMGGLSKSRIAYIDNILQINEINWLCNCSDEDRTVTLNASIKSWNLNDFVFYYASGNPGSNNFKFGEEIGNNGAQITIPKKTNKGQMNVDYPYGFDNCKCVKLVTMPKSVTVSHKLPGILNITAQDTSDANIKAKANVAFLSGANAIYPVLNVKNDGTNLTLSWYDPFATSYTLFYLPMDLSKVGQVPLGKLENATVPSSNIPPLYIAIYACHADGTCDFSNIEKTQ